MSKPNMMKIARKHRDSVCHLYDSVDNTMHKLRKHQTSEEPDEVKQQYWDKTFGAKETEASMVIKMIGAYHKIIPMEEKVNKSLLREYKKKYKPKAYEKMDPVDREIMKRYIEKQEERKKYGICATEGWYRMRKLNPLYPRKIGDVDNDVDQHPENWEHLPDTRGLEPQHGGPGLLYGIKDPLAWERGEENPPPDSDYWKKGLDFPPNYYRDIIHVAHERELARQRGQWVDGRARFEKDGRRVVPIFLVGYGPQEDIAAMEGKPAEITEGQEGSAANDNTAGQDNNVDETSGIGDYGLDEPTPEIKGPGAAEQNADNAAAAVEGGDATAADSGSVKATEPDKVPAASAATNTPVPAPAAAPPAPAAPARKVDPMRPSRYIW